MIRCAVVIMLHVIATEEKEMSKLSVSRAGRKPDVYSWILEGRGDSE